MTGGWIQVNNELIRVPSGTIVVFPNTFLTWEEMFEFNPNVHQTDAVKESGLALADTVRFPGTYEVGIDANIVNGQHIAGIIRIAQDPLNTVSGFIERIDYANGVLYVAGQRIQLNDPKITINIPNPDGSPTGVIITKAAVIFLVFVWVRGTLPRFRYDQLMQFAWKRMLPISLVLLSLSALFASLSSLLGPIVRLAPGVR